MKSDAAHPGPDAYLLLIDNVISDLTRFLGKTNGVLIVGLQRDYRELACAEISIAEPHHHDEVQSDWCYS